MTSESSSETNRAERERERYNEGLAREGYDKVFNHALYYYRLRRLAIVKHVLERAAAGKRALELGSVSWLDWLERRDIVPADLHCINISETELDKGKYLARDRRNVPQFHLMDAQELEFEDDRFDVVFGNAILHHVDLRRALDEVQRVLAPGGTVLFLEPLDLNPVGWLVRSATPHARTEDEKPFRRAELREIRRRFDCTMYYEQLLAVPAGVLSRAIFAKPANPLNRAAYGLDRAIDKALPPLRPFFRNVLIEGRPHPVQPR